MRGIVFFFLLLLFFTIKKNKQNAQKQVRIKDIAEQPNDTHVYLYYPSVKFCKGKQKKKEMVTNIMQIFLFAYKIFFCGNSKLSSSFYFLSTFLLDSSVPLELLFSFLWFSFFSFFFFIFFLIRLLLYPLFFVRCTLAAGLNFFFTFVSVMQVQMCLFISGAIYNIIVP